MASLANIYNRIFDRNLERSATARPLPSRLSNQPDTFSTRVRPFANDDIYFFVKHIDNSGVFRQADPGSRGTAWKMIGSVVTAAALLIGVLLPGAYSLMAGYQIQSLKQEASRLAAERTSLEIQESQLVSPARMEELARQQQFIDPPSEKVVYLDTKSGGSLAMVRKR